MTERTSKAKRPAKVRLDKALEALLSHLRRGSPKKLEELVADLVTRLVGVQISVAASGFQAGGDGGSTGRGGRHLRIECKRYGDRSPLSDRELEGEVDQALRRNPDLEVWVLAATCSVTETTQETLNIKARETGVPILVIDWASRGQTLPDLAALCSWGSDIVGKHYGVQAADVAESLSAEATSVVARIQAELEPWRIGYERVRESSHDRLDEIWSNEDQSRAAFAQNVAGGAARYLVQRKASLDLLQTWWETCGGKPAVVYGMEGVGKTWAAMHWLMSSTAQGGVLRFPAFNQASLKRSMSDGDAHQLELL